MQTLQELLVKKKLSNNTTKVREFLSGKRVKIISNKSGHNQSIGSVVELTSPAHISVQYYNGNNHSILYFYDVVLLQDETIADIVETIRLHEKTIKEANKEIESLKLKEDFMMVNKLETWNEDEYKVYTVLQTLKTKKSDLEKAKVIAELIKS